MRVAAYQGPYLPFGFGQAVELIQRQLQQCEGEGVELLCCPESFLGGLAYESDGQSPADVALSVGELACLLAQVMSSPVASVIGFTERAEAGKLYSSVVVVADGAIQLVQRKVYPGYRTAISAGPELPVIPFRDTVFGILICDDIWYAEPARILANKGAELILVPTNSGHLRRDSTLKNRFRTRGETLAVARAVDNTVSIVQADVAGSNRGGSPWGVAASLTPTARCSPPPTPRLSGSSLPTSSHTRGRSIRAAGTPARTPR